MTQQPMIGRPDPHNRAGRLFPRVLDGAGNVHHGAWEAARLANDAVGTCRNPGHLLAAGAPYRQGMVWWYPATCRAHDCDYETAAHGPRPTRK